MPVHTPTSNFEGLTEFYEMFSQYYSMVGHPKHIVFNILQQYQYGERANDTNTTYCYVTKRHVMTEIRGVCNQRYGNTL